MSTIGNVQMDEIDVKELNSTVRHLMDVWMVLSMPI